MKNKKIFLLLQAIFMFAGFAQLTKSDASYVPYLFIVILSFIFLIDNSKKYLKIKNINKHMRCLIIIFTIMLTLMVTLSNYNLWVSKGLSGLLIFINILLGNLFAFYNIFLWLALNKKKIIWKNSDNWKPLYVFLITFAIFSIINLVILFACNYPGNLTTDSISQLNQILSGHYSNHHPYYDTITIKIFFTIGMKLFHNINAAVACYSVFSIIFMAITFAFTIATVDEIHASKWIIVFLTLFFALMPYHIMYSMTMWKDILFGAFVLLFCVFFFRAILNMSLKPLNIIGLIISSFGFCLYRSNGFFAYLFTVFLFVILWKLKEKRILLLIIIALIGSFTLKHPVLKSLNVKQPDIIESLSIPTQQISRDIVDNNDLTRSQYKLLSNVIDIKSIPKYYNSHISDPIKNLVREKNNQNYIKEHRWQFVNLYISIGLKHPFTYVKSWIDQTCGYLNAGYSYWKWSDGVKQNDFGIQRKVYSNKIDYFVDRYCNMFENISSLEIFVCIGFFVWLMIFALFISIIREDKIGILLSTSNLMIIFSLLIATPVFSEFRYAYAIFCTLPFIIVIVLRPKKYFYKADSNKNSLSE